MTFPHCQSIYRCINSNKNPFIYYYIYLIFFKLRLHTYPTSSSTSHYGPADLNILFLSIVIQNFWFSFSLLIEIFQGFSKDCKFEFYFKESYLVRSFSCLLSYYDPKISESKFSHCILRLSFALVQNETLHQPV